jgi:hypothetical protein
MVEVLVPPEPPIPRPPSNPCVTDEITELAYLARVSLILQVGSVSEVTNPILRLVQTHDPQYTCPLNCVLFALSPSPLITTSIDAATGLVTLGAADPSLAGLERSYSVTCTSSLSSAPQPSADSMFTVAFAHECEGSLVTPPAIASSTCSLLDECLVTINEPQPSNGDCSGARLGGFDYTISIVDEN